MFLTTSMLHVRLQCFNYLMSIGNIGFDTLALVGDSVATIGPSSRSHRERKIFGRIFRQLKSEQWQLLT